ncbi:hypothetical protein PB1_02570 [Bacillus methanolicus PB1]|uniref:Uncharacterized protein n=1 Tax=Bacillus methanolicus PB1 TaxID=997296 RepID=I3E5L6_BACMT|nr:hypothetical protein [Bacillus methanolicus]EIJ81787.1 hypothetical protein PB1_02570 [Bacillus methanolicus PB1]
MLKNLLYALFYFAILFILYHLTARFILAKYAVNQVRRGKKIQYLLVFPLSFIFGSHRQIHILKKLPENLDCPISKNEIKFILREVYKKYPLSIIGIERIFIMERPPYLNECVRGSYRPTGFLKGEICLFGFSYENGIYYHGFGESTFWADEQITKYAVINTLLHELGHHLRYVTLGDLHGQEVEKYCDDFATALALEFNLTPGILEEERLVEEYTLNQLRNELSDAKKKFEDAIKKHEDTKIEYIRLKRLLQEKKEKRK